MHNAREAEELQTAVDNAITEVARIGRKAHSAGDAQVAGQAFTASELLRGVLFDVDSIVAERGEAARVPFDKPATEKRTRKPRAAKASAKTETPEAPATTPKLTTTNGHATAAGAE